MPRVPNKAPDGQTLQSLPTQVIEGDFGEVLIGGYEAVSYDPWSMGDNNPTTEGRVVVTVVGHDNVARLSLSAENVDQLTWALVDAGKWAQVVSEQKRVVKMPRPPMPMPMPMDDQEGESDAKD